MKQHNISQIVEEARRSNSTTYFTWKPCKRGHVAPRTVKGGTCLECAREYFSSETNWDTYLKRTYNIDSAHYSKLLESQDNKCPICGMKLLPDDKDNRKTLGKSVDHCHTSGQVRGILCTSCNKGLGMFNDDISRLYKAIEYLNKWSSSD